MPSVAARVSIRAFRSSGSRSENRACSADVSTVRGSEVGSAGTNVTSSPLTRRSIRSIPMAAESSVRAIDIASSIRALARGRATVIIRSATFMALSDPIDPTASRSDRRASVNHDVCMASS